MQLFELQQAIKVKFEVPNLLVFTGSEYAIIELYINQICSQLNLNRQNISRVDQVIKPHGIINILGDKKLYICRYDVDFTKKENLWNGINTKLGSNYLILILSSVDNRSKFSKQFSHNIVEFNEQPVNTVEIMLQNKIKLTKPNLQRLMLGCKYNYSKIVLEIEKIKTLSKVRNISEDAAYELLLTDGTICEAQDTKLQEFIDSVMNKNPRCFSLYRALINNNESNLTMIAWLYNAVRNQLSVQTVVNPNTETTGLNYFFIKECLGRKNIYTNSELVNFLKLIKYCEQGIKNGNMEEQNSVNYILVNAL